MSDLQTGLIALGVLAIVVVLGLNWWQDRRARKQIQDGFPDSGKDPLLHGAEPGMPPTEGLRREPALGSAIESDGNVVGGLAARDADAPAPQHDTDEVDEACETVIDISFLEPVPGDELAAFTQGIRHAGQKSLRVFAETTEGVHRSAIRSGERYASVQVAVLLANRSGPLSAGEWAEALSRSRVLADRFDGTVEASDSQAVLDRANKLDAVCAALDAQVGLTLVASSRRWSSSDVLTAAREAGFSSIHDGRLPWIDEHGAVRFTLGRSDGVSLGSAGAATIGQLSLILDVPRAPADEHAFSRMAKVARQLSGRLEATVVDDNGRPLADGAEAAIDKQLQALYARLEHSGLKAGSVRAMRVFG
ncbi:MAG: cell division protein ZipA C-terminal FtsZ-binding domain-containing protein [Pigmentiphaga sp.]|uniref:cell division protein ZipA C-terminal FtsZ-binding domain-containing protein n=1 Tax=Pigmentiphaga sp. TaxID=1977564 RepID=UPI0029A52C02|nr:cell division protein ZipA C-terminal FtsZ-binding domain-containing protein [Pigmentiphaga sp.]MDX3905651.1 cell division protein ZipA C-terminal FtsZ-binding domain-containing protein [Pigmentiphaga sp.]